MPKCMGADNSVRTDTVLWANKVERIDEGLELDVAFCAHCRWVDIIPRGAEVESILVQSPRQAPRVPAHRLQGSDIKRLISRKGTSLHTIGRRRPVTPERLEEGRGQQRAIGCRAVERPVPIRLCTGVVTLGAQDILKGPDGVAVPRKKDADAVDAVYGNRWARGVC